MLNVATVQTTAYEGWSNRETWLASLWLNNDEDGNRLLQEAKRQPGGLNEQAQWLCDEYEESLYALLTYDQVFGEASLFSDLIQHALDQVNWREIIESN
jgi:hypothetical protein